MSGKKFNIFQVAGIWNDEVAHTRVIAELINPQSAFHDKGAEFLELFLQGVGIGEPQSEQLKDAVVKVEVPTSEGKSIDMVISTKNDYLPFEVKVGAVDQDAQLQDYFAFAKGQGKKVPWIYYLTKDRHNPSEKSRGALSDDEIYPLTFEEEIVPWLEKCLNVPDTPGDVLAVMKQLRDNIQGRPGTQGFYPWDVLDAIYQKLSQEYDLPWTECNKYYMTFTLNRKSFEKASLEFALRFEKTGADRVRLYLISGITVKDEEADYHTSVTDRYLSENAGHFDVLLKDTSQEDASLKLKTGKGVFDRLPDGDRYKNLDAEQCCREIETIFMELRPACRPVPKENEN